MKLYIVGAIILVSLISGVIIANRRDAAKEALQEVERKNNEKGNAADDARSRFDICPDGMWDYGSNRCRVTP